MKRLWRWYFSLPTWAYVVIMLVWWGLGYLSSVAVETCTK